MSISPDIFENTEVAFANKGNADLQKAKVLFGFMANNGLVSMGSSLANFALALHLPVAPIFRWTVYNHFCGGETFNECKRTISKLDNSGVGVLLNYGVELKETEKDFDTTLNKNIEALEFSGKHQTVKGLCLKLTGIGQHAIFEKIQKGDILSAEEKKGFEGVKKRFEKLCAAAAKNNVPVYVDAEESWIQDPLDNMVDQMMAKYNHGKCIVCNTFQLYRHDRLDFLKTSIEKAKAGNYLLGAKLVRGAYMEKERKRAKDMGYPSPIHKSKKEVDKDFNASVNLCLDNIENLYLCIASQSEESNLLAIELVEKKNITHNHQRILFSQLYGMGDNITFNLARLGFNATKYLPYGPVTEVIPYLIRRAEENTSVAGQTSRELSLLNKEIKRRRAN